MTTVTRQRVTKAIAYPKYESLAFPVAARDDSAIWVWLRRKHYLFEITLCINLYTPGERVAFCTLSLFVLYNKRHPISLSQSRHPALFVTRS
ncbi:Malic enzyme, NAD-binding protein [Purpureocillium lavendulum]|uniref:Malic enzyme, NAD-binding protein n=1 Tax=Purpureocillium lavendulum TaxID=1247861 RepID=A0AB34FW21_9HYPO|nr:Malic enzyme, NAD-binding protein [Purpureocillium lavendulum]